MHIFIINPKAGNGKGIELIPRLNEIEEKIIYVTKEKGDATKFLLDVAKKYSDATIYSIGGDGTLNEVISGNIERKKPILLGHLPLGSVNDVAHMYGMSSNTSKNIVMLLNGVQKNIDVCLINNNPFVYVACIGAYVDISYATPRKLKEK